MKELLVSAFARNQEGGKAEILCFVFAKDSFKISYADSLTTKLEYIYFLVLTKNQENLYGCGGKGTVFRYSYTTLETELFVGHKDEVWSLALFEEKGMMATTGYD